VLGTVYRTVHTVVLSTVHTVVYSAVYSLVFSTVYSILLVKICRKQVRGFSSGNKPLLSLVTVYCTLKCTLYSTVYIEIFSTVYVCGVSSYSVRCNFTAFED
jgi:hypothetical protein